MNKYFVCYCILSQDLYLYEKLLFEKLYSNNRKLEYII